MKNRSGDCSTTVVKADSMKYSWNDNEQPLLEIESFSVHRGETLFIAGPSGSGKSTLLGLLTGILQPTFGDIVVLDQSLSELKNVARDKFRVDNIGYVFQMFNLIPYLNIVENVLLPCKFSKKRREKALAAGGSLNREALRLLKKLGLDQDTVLAKPVVELSVGQQQRVAVARALIGSPEIVVADEPTSALDFGHRQAFLDLLFSECKKSNATLIFVSHDTGLATMFNRVVELEEINRSSLGKGGNDV